MNPYWQQKKLREYCKSNGILVVGYAALGAVGTFYGTNRVMECHVLKKIAEERAKTVPQVLKFEIQLFIHNTIQFTKEAHLLFFNAGLFEMGIRARDWCVGKKFQQRQDEAEP